VAFPHTESVRHPLRLKILATAASCAALALAASCGREAPYLLPVPAGSIAVTANLDGATIFLDEAPTGTATPDTLRDVEIGQHVVRVALAGYEVAPPSLVVEVAANEVATASFTLAPTLPRVVLMEEFSNVDCLGCPDLAAVTHSLMDLDGYGLDRLLLVNISGTFPEPYDPHYLANTEAHDARLEYYDAVTGLPYPSLMLDGLLFGEAGVAPTLAALQAGVDAEYTRSPGFIIEVEADVAQVDIAVSVELESLNDVDIGGCHLGLYLAEEEIHYPRGAPGSNGQQTFHWMLRDYAEVAIDATTLTAGVPLVLEGALQRLLSWDDVIVIAFVQRTATREVLQAGSTGHAHGRVRAAAETDHPSRSVPSSRIGGEP
jgi:hypothetical protein